MEYTKKDLYYECAICGGQFADVTTLEKHEKAAGHTNIN